jgi:hypothetical protein
MRELATSRIGIDKGVVVDRPVEATPDPDGVLRLPATAPADEHG